MKPTLLLLLVGAAAGCAGPNLDALKWRASHDLNCAEDKLVLTPLDEDGEKWGLRGCDRDAAYAWSTDGKKEWLMTKKPTESAPAASVAP
jgi:hypothetical protein